MSAASQQYGGLTVAEIDKIAEKYMIKSYKKYYNQYVEIAKDVNLSTYDLHYKADEYAIKNLKVETRQLVQAWEYKLNSVSSSRGDYPFITMTFGLGTTKLQKMFSTTLMEVRMNGQGQKGKERAVLFPKLVFLYDENLHGKGCINEDLFETGIKCSSKCMYPDWLSLTGFDPYEIDETKDNTVQLIYKKYHKAISPMGCRSFLSPYWKKGGFYKADETDEPLFIGRGNLGVVSLNLPMIYQKSIVEGTEFFEALSHYMEIIRNIHKKTIDLLSKLKASVNPLGFCEGGLLGGYLTPDQSIEPLLKSFTTSFGYVGLNELQQLYNSKSLVEDGEFAVTTLKFISDTVERYKKEDNILHSVYGTPAETTAGTMCKFFRDKSNSFHCHVSEDISPIQKQDLESRFWSYSQGGRIQYCRYDNNYNLESFRTIIRRAMKMNFYEGVNLSLSYCDDCGHSFIDSKVCPECGSTNVTILDRVCGYLGYTQVNGKSRMCDTKLDEIEDRKSM
jgi:ribonucleoside-triphosphate reductase